MRIKARSVFGIPSHQLCVKLLVVGQDHLDLIGILDHMVVGDDETAVIDDKSGTQAALFEVALLAIALKRAEKFVKRAPVAAMGVAEKMTERPDCRL